MLRGKAGGMQRELKSRLTAQEVWQLERLVGDDVEDQEAVLAFISHFYSADNLFWVPRRVYEEIVRRPGDFVRAARGFVSTESGQ